jgi:tRNA threonylcarbamoyladenosine biosynthesis protein TsaB
LKLALDTAHTSGSLALWETGCIVYSAWFDIRITHSETLMPQLDQALAFCGYKPGDIEAVLLTLGPGSFTGLRIGLATAKGIAYGLKVPVWGYSTLQLWAVQRHNCGRNILAVLDAKMKEVYAALYDEDLRELIPPRVCAPEVIAAWDTGGAYLVGSGTPLLEPLLRDRGVAFTSVPLLPATASSLFFLANLFPQPAACDLESLARLEPLYLRESTAQVKQRAKQD